MAHHHHHHHSEKNIGIAFLLNLVFTIVEFIGGWWTNSLAIMSDAVHDLGDSLSLGLAWYFERIAKRPVDAHFTYGYKRFSVVGAIINSIVLIIGAFFILQTAIPRLFDPQSANSIGMIGLAFLGILFNGLAYWKTHKGHSHNESVISLHLLEDTLGWAAVLIGAVVMYFTNWYLIDPILSIAISLFILYNVIKNIRQTLNIILQGSPDHISHNTVLEKIKSIDDVLDVHDLHIWTMDGRLHVLTAHVVVSKSHSLKDITDIKKQIHQSMLSCDIHHCTIEFESEGEVCEVIH